MKKRAQIALEFIIFIMLGIFMLLVFISLGVNLTVDALEDQGIQEAEELIYTIQEELILAAQVHTGYHRILEIPLQLRRGEYTLTNTKESITITKNELTITLKIPIVNGTLIKGTNVIKREQEKIIITN